MTSEALKIGKPVLLVVDFNENISDVNNDLLSDLLGIFYLEYVIYEPTRVTSSISSLLDIIIITNDIPVVTSGVVDLHLSDHLGTYVTNRSGSVKCISMKCMMLSENRHGQI